MRGRDMSVLSVGDVTFSSDSRYKVIHVPRPRLAASDWNLQVSKKLKLCKMEHEIKGPLEGRGGERSFSKRRKSHTHPEIRDNMQQGQRPFLDAAAEGMYT
jgi:hypothetical protein